jgi:hypothetical protein
MESHITIIEPQKNPNIKCLNVSKPLNNRLNIPTGNNIVPHKERSSTTTPILENLPGNYPMKLKYINEN